MAAERDYARERQRARERAAALGLSPSAALGKPRKGEQSKRAAGFDLRTRAGQVAAQAAAAARGERLPAPATLQTMRTSAGNVAQSSSPRVLNRSVMNLRPSRHVQVNVETRDPVTGATRILQPWKRGGIRAGELQTMIEDAGGSLVQAIIDAAGQGQAGSTDIDALDDDGAGIVSVSVVYQ